MPDLARAGAQSERNVNGRYIKVMQSFYLSRNADFPIGYFNRHFLPGGCNLINA
ncbi:hypothetical protein ALC62_15866 [Cyphomyrmex costatus]|uniref:Uncharacterized protein n=1 Tax=Cyphomyrmex costatus TaxID=456900 RepID=A0A195C024_9HYME|nr:hypothetical protein ALC62_15866 [Cyphomyrmex costatus]